MFVCCSKRQTLRKFFTNYLEILTQLRIIVQYVRVKTCIFLYSYKIFNFSTSFFIVSHLNDYRNKCRKFQLDRSGRNVIFINRTHVGNVNIFKEKGTLTERDFDRKYYYYKGND